MQPTRSSLRPVSSPRMRWINAELLALQSSRTELRKKVVQTEGKLQMEVMGDLIERPTERAEIVLHQEIRSYLSLTDNL